MAQLKPRAKQATLSINVIDTNPEVNGFSYTTSPAIRSPARNPRLENRLKEAWSRAEKEFQRETGRTLALGSYDIKSKDGILRQFKQKYDADDSDSKKSSALNLGTLENVLNAVTVVGAFAAQAVSIVFGPADLCFNAIAFLLAVPAQLKKVYDELQALFEEIERFLTKFKIYKRIEDGASLGDELFENVSNVLTCLIRVCAIAARVLQGGWRDRMKNSLQVVLLQNDKVGAALQEFEKLCKASDSLANTVMLEHVLSSEADIKAIMSSSRKVEGGVGVLLARSNDDINKAKSRDHLSKIREKLFSNLPPSAEDPTVSPYHENYDETFECLYDSEEYNQWLDPSTSRSTLVIWGPPGSGKSYMLDAVREQLNTNRQMLGETDQPIYVAKHTFDDNRSKAVNSADNSVSNKSAAKAEALRRIAYQIAIQAPQYAKDLSTRLFESSKSDKDARTKKDIRSKDIQKVWNRLEIPQITTAYGASLYVLLDGVDEEIKGDLKELLSLFMTPPTHEGLRIRVLLVMNMSSSSPLPGHFYEISIESINKKLLASFASQEMRANNFLQEFDKQTRMFREEILKRLSADATDVTFRSIRQKLTQLQDAINEDRPSHVMSQILDASNAGAQSTDEALQIIAELETTLTVPGITLLNAILAVLLYAPNGYLAPDELEALLKAQKVDLPIEPLIKKIRQRFSKVLYCSDYGVWVEYAVESALKDLDASTNPTDAISKPESLISLNITISNAPEPVIRKFVWDLNEQVSSGKFDFSLSKADKSNHKISVDGLKAQLSTVQVLFRILSQGWNKESKPLVELAYDTIPRYMAALQTFAPRIATADRKTIAEGLISYLTDAYHTRLNHEMYGWARWMSDEESIAAMRFWLEDKATFETLRIRDQRWVREVTDHSLGKLGFLRDLANLVAKQWLTDIRSNGYALFSWLERYIETNVPMTIESDDDDKDTTPDIEQSLSVSQQGNALQNTLNSSTKPVPDSDKRPESVSPEQDVAQSIEGDSNVTSIEKDPEDIVHAIPKVAQGEEQDTTPGKSDETPTPIEKETTTIERIDRVASWAKEHTSLVEDDNYFLVMGEICASHGEYATSATYYGKISEHYSNQSFVQLGRTYCALGLEDAETAFKHARTAFDTLRQQADKGALSEEDSERYLENLIRCGREFGRLDRHKDAIAFYEEALARRPDDDSYYWTVVKLQCQVGLQSQSHQSLLEWTQDGNKFGGKTPSMSLVELMTNEGFDTIMTICRSLQPGVLRDLMVSTIDQAFRIASERREFVAKGLLLFLQGILLCQETNPELAIRATDRWRELVDIYVPESDPDFYSLEAVVGQAGRGIIQSDFESVHERLLVQSPLTYEEKMSLLTETKTNFDHLMNSNTTLRASHGVESTESFIIHLYGILDMKEAQQMLKVDMALALDILGDADPDNDVAGLNILARIFCVLNDEVGVLSVLSLCDREVTRKRLEANANNLPVPELDTSQKLAAGFYRACDFCGKDIFSSDIDGIWWCRFCPGFADWCMDCKTKRENGTLRLEICHPRHISSYIHVVHPEYTEAELEGTKVSIDWQLGRDETRRVTRKGGRIIELADWVKELRESWNIPKPEDEVIPVED